MSRRCAMQGALFPPVSFDLIERQVADDLLREWGHEEGPCRRPFAVQRWGLHLAGEIVSLAISASTVGFKAAGYDRLDCVDLARLCTAPGNCNLTRVCLRLWREVAAPAFRVAAQTHPDRRPRVAVTYCRKGRAGHIFRADGWKRHGETRGGRSGPGSGWTPGRAYGPKVIWTWSLAEGTP